jgi:signal transduction histidine kinase
MNLVINAIQAIDGPGTITLTTRLLPGGAQVEVGVRDTGKGIARDHLHRIFEPFFTTKAFGAKGGTGLGLSISYGIVERHGGQILVDSEPGQGTEFRVVLPVKAAPPVTQGSL